jgi:hypothetical protein
MSFLNPLGLLGLLALPVIIGLHMHRERSRRIVVSSLNLWSFLDVQLRGSKPRQVRITWLLVIDLLIAILLSFALSRPEISSSFLFDRNEHIIILLDDSSSMLAADVVLTRFDSARSDIQSLLDNLNSRDIVSVYTIGGQVSFIGDSRKTNIRDVSGKVKKLQAGDIGVDLSSALSLALSSVSRHLHVVIHIYTDGAYEDPGIHNLGYPVIWHIYGINSENQAVTNIRTAELGSGNHQVFANITNFASQSIKRDIVLFVNGDEVDRVPIEFPPKSVIPQSWDLSGQPRSVTVSLSGEDILPHDDFGSFGMNPARSVRVALVSDNPDPVDRAILSAPNVELSIFTPSAIFSHTDYDLIVYRGYLPQSWPSGDILVFDPPTGSDLLRIGGVREFSGQPSSGELELFKGVEFSGLRWGSVWEIIDWESQYTPLLWAGDMPLLLSRKIDFSNILIFLSVLDEGNITRHPFFPIFISNIVSASGGYEFPNQISVGSEIRLPLQNEYPTVIVTNQKGQEISPLNGNRELFSQTKTPGIYQIKITDLNGISEEYSIAVNTGSLAESNLTPGDWVQSVEIGAESGMGKEVQVFDLSPLLLFVALALIFLEALLSWR